MWCSVVWYLWSIVSEDITPTSSGLTYRRTTQAIEKCNSESDPMIFNNSISSTDVIGQWEGNCERRTVNNSRENLQDARIPRISYSQEWFAHGVESLFPYYFTIQLQVMELNWIPIKFLCFFLSLLVLTSVYLLTGVIDHTQWHTHTRTHTHTHTQSRQGFSGRGISPKQKPLPFNTQHSQQTSMSLAGFKPSIPASERSQTHALDRAATGIGSSQLTSLCSEGLQTASSLTWRKTLSPTALQPGVGLGLLQEFPPSFPA